MDLIDTKYWSDLSTDGQVCGMIGCKGDPTCKCPECNHFYCLEHIKVHFHTKIEWRNKNAL